MPNLQRKQYESNFDPTPSTYTIPHAEGLLLWTMLAYEIDTIPESEQNSMQMPSDTMLFEKVLCELFNTDGDKKKN